MCRSTLWDLEVEGAIVSEGDRGGHHLVVKRTCNPYGAPLSQYQQRLHRCQVREHEM